MYNNLFKIGNYIVHSYGLCISIGIIVALFVLRYRLKKYNQDYNRAIDIILIAVIPGFVGAKSIYILTKIDSYIDGSLSFMDLVREGNVIYGGLIFGSISTIVYLRLSHLAVLEYSDTIIASVAIAQCFGRIGCFLAGCCYGISYTGFGSIQFKNSDFAPIYPVFPTQIIFVICDLILFLFLCFIKPRVKKHGTVLALYIIIYSIGRFGLEFLRGDKHRGTVLNVSTSQFIAIITFIIGIIFYLCINTNIIKRIHIKWHNKN